MKGSNSPKAHEIALSGISCAVAVVFLTLGLLTPYLTATGYLIGIIALMAPLARDYYKGCFFAWLGTCILALVLGAAAKFWDIVPFIMFFGLHPLLNALQLRLNINRLLAFAVKAVWFDLTLICGYYLVLGGVVGGSLLPESVYETINRYIWAFVFTVGTVIFFVYDRLIFKCQIYMNVLVRRVLK